MTITAVGSIYKTSNTNTLAVSPTTLGDILVLAAGSSQSGTGNAITSVSGGGVATWIAAAGQILTNGAGVIWYGVITSTGASTITCTMSVSGTSGLVLGAQQFTGPGAWSVDGSFGGNTGTAASGNYPSLTPTGSAELYVGCLYVPSNLFNTDPTGSSAGFTYVNFSGTGGGTLRNMGLLVYESASSPTAYSPNWTLPSGNPFNFAACSVIFKSAATMQIIGIV